MTDTDREHPRMALAVRSRHEKRAQAGLESKGYLTFLPLMHTHNEPQSGTAWEGRRPLIPGYVFASLRPGNAFRMLTAPGVMRVVGFGSKPGVVRHEEIEILERIANSGLPAMPCGYGRPGEVVELVKGPLKFTQGVIVRETKGARLVVNVDLLQRSLMVDIDSEWSVPIRACCAS